MKKNGVLKGCLFGVLTALCSALIVPGNKLLSGTVPYAIGGGTLYFGAFLFAAVLLLIRLISGKHIAPESKITKKDVPYLIGVVVMDSVGVVTLVVGISMINGANAALLSNFELLATSFIAFFLFKEKISPMLWGGICLIFIACALVSIGDVGAFEFSIGSILVLISAVSYGFGNNFQKKVAEKDQSLLLLIIGGFSALTCVVTGLLMGERITDLISLLPYVGLGVVSYGASLFAYIKAQSLIGAARTGVFFSMNPFIGSIICLIAFNEEQGWLFYVGLGIMAIGAFLAAYDGLKSEKKAVEEPTAID